MSKNTNLSCIISGLEETILNQNMDYSENRAGQTSLLSCVTQKTMFGRYCCARAAELFNKSDYLGPVGCNEWQAAPRESTESLEEAGNSKESIFESP